MNELGRFASYHEINLAVEHVKQRQHLVDGLAVVGLIQQPVKLCRRCPEPSNDLSFGQSGRVDAPLSLNRQFVEQEIAQVPGVLIVLEYLFHMNGTFLTGRQHVGKPFSTKLFVHANSLNWIICSGPRISFGVGKYEASGGGLELEEFFPIIVRH